MKWQGRRTSTNVEDRRGRSVRGGAIGGGVGGVIYYNPHNSGHAYT